MFKMILEENYLELDEEMLISVNGGGCTGGVCTGGRPSGGGGLSGGVSSGAGGCTNSGVQASIMNNRGHRYVKPTQANNYNEYMCDNWVQEVLSDAGIDYNNYFAGDAKNYNCEQHIADLKNSNREYTTGTQTTGAPTSEGVYVVLMNEGHSYTRKDGSTGVYGAHTGLLVVNSNGNATFWDNSSGNYNNGVAPTGNGTTSSQSVMGQFGYDSFYYQKINE